MYTRCPECETTFRLGAEDLRRAQGKVRCGDCSHVFNALEFLAEEPDPTSTSDELPVLTSAASKPEPVAEHAGDIELEIRAYDEKTGETWSPLETGSWEADNFADLEDDDSEHGELDEPEPESAEGDDTELDEPLAGMTSMPYAPVNDPVPETDASETDADEPAEPANELEEPADEPSDDEGPDFDDTVWERIPGVGASEEDSANWLAPDPDDTLADGLSYTGKDLSEFEDETVEQPIPEDVSVGETQDQPAASQAGQEETVEQPVAEAFSQDETVEQPAVVDTDDPWYEDESPEEAAMTFDVPADKWSTFFGDEPRPAAPLPAVANPDTDEGTAPIDDAFQAAEKNLAGTTADESADDSDENDPLLDPTASWPDFESHEEVVMETGEFGVGDFADADESNEDDLPDAQAGSDETDDTAASANIDADDTAEHPGWQNDESARPSRRGIWALGITLLSVALAAQLIHYNRDLLAASPAYGDSIRSLYAALGADLYPDWATQSYEIRGSEAVAGESGPDVLDIRTQIAAVSDTAVGLPYLRVILRDRWANPVAAKNFAPDEYAVSDSLPQDGLLKPNQTIAAHVAIVDPGSGAQGFELELCLPRRHTGLDCTGQTP